MREPRHAPMAGASGAEASASGQAMSWTLPFRIAWSVIRGVMEGALPLVILVCVLALFWEVLTIVRYVTAANGFAVTQLIETIIAEGGLVVSLAVYLVAALRTLRGVRDRQYEGDYVESWVALAVLGVSIVVAIIPVLSLVNMPQHPAP
jgi:hypothetical protein